VITVEQIQSRLIQIKTELWLKASALAGTGAEAVFQTFLGEMRISAAGYHTNDRVRRRRMEVFAFLFSHGWKGRRRR
jgi:hypothetical protein